MPPRTTCRVSARWFGEHEEACGEGRVDSGLNVVTLDVLRLLPLGRSFGGTRLAGQLRLMASYGGYEDDDVSSTVRNAMCRDSLPRECCSVTGEVDPDHQGKYHGLRTVHVL